MMFYPSVQHFSAFTLSLFTFNFGLFTFGQELFLHPSHYPFVLYSNPEFGEVCKLDSSCPSKDAVERKCWGYEDNCQYEDRHNQEWPICTTFDKRWANSLEEQRRKYWNRTDFGFVREEKNSMKEICSQKLEQHISKLTCSAFIRHCLAENLMLDFTGYRFENPVEKFSVAAFETPGIMKANCVVNKNYLLTQNEHFSTLQSWYGELREVSHEDFQFDDCDLVLEKPTYFMKLDAGINMYHHFCDFVNLYLSQHINGTFSRDINIVWWDMGNHGYGDLFEQTWEAFTQNPIIKLNNWEGKKVCVKSAVFSLLPRMRFGFFYNMPLVPHCSGSEVIRAFSQHVLHRLGVKQNKPQRGKVRITFLERQSRHRNIVNQDELIRALEDAYKNIEVKKVVYNWRTISFKEQLEITHNTDIFIGMHGAGLTHGFFLPDWGVLFELYNCGDVHCYHDIARLRGVKYITWEKTELLASHNETLHPTLKTPHGKFNDYSFNVKEFLRLMKNALYHVRNHQSYRRHFRDEL
ncbi:EGF domain-specific O-linked N-acetylglucosamine transferase-like [Apostichopus japonicus]|uniref:EGF domain-specific O-linked N-acetylglucosamine transferase-like n=1 Tax=Stichopus japonicus TaxID=307972 RepID=UPI003AB1EF2B